MKKEMLKATTQKSYYGKATVIYNDNGTVDLKSYDTIVISIVNGEPVKRWNGYSNTTKNHVNDFLRLFGFEPINKKAWDLMPCDNADKYRVVYSNGFFSGKAGVVFDNESDAELYAEKLEKTSGYRIAAWVE